MASSSTVAPAHEENEKDKQVPNEAPPPYSPGNYGLGANQMTTYGTGGESYPMQAHAGPMTQPSAAIVVTTQPIPSTIQYGFGDTPAAIVCPYCNSSVITMLRYQTGAMTWTIFAFLMFCLCWLCAWIPFVSNGTKDVVHVCPTCSKILGVYRRFWARTSNNLQNKKPIYPTFLFKIS